MKHEKEQKERKEEEEQQEEGEAEIDLLSRDGRQRAAIKMPHRAEIGRHRAMHTADKVPEDRCVISTTN